jgi:exosortase/archaeosortase family protein
MLAFWASGAILFAVFPAIDRWAIRQTVGGLSFVLHILARRIAVSGNGFSLEGASVQIVSECTTLLPSLLLAGAIIAYPANTHRKLLGLTAGLALLWMFNAVRIIVLLIILARYPSVFDLIHIYLWQTLTMAVIAGIFGLWLGTGTSRATA